MADDTAISYLAAVPGTPVLSSTGTPVYRVDALEDTGKSFHDVLGRLFRRPHWTREHD